MTRRSRLVSLSRESETIVGDEEALNDVSVHADVVTDVEVKANTISGIIDEMEEAENEAQSLQNTADMINETIDDNGEGVDSLTTELVQEKIETAVEKYQLQTINTGFSRESHSCIEVKNSRQLAQEAYQTANSIREKLVKAFTKIITWIKELMNSWVSNHSKLQMKVKKLKDKYSKKSTEVDPNRCTIKASRLGNRDVLKEVEKLETFSKSKYQDWFHFIEFNSSGEMIWNRSKTGINVFRACGGSLGGKSIKIAQGENNHLYQLNIDDLDNKFGDFTIRGVTREQGLEVLNLLEKALENYKPLEKDIVVYVKHVEVMAKQIIEAGSKDPESIGTAAKKRIAINTLNKLVSSVLSTYLRVISVSTQVCSQCLQ